MASKRASAPLRSALSSNPVKSRWKCAAETTYPTQSLRSMASEASSSPRAFPDATAYRTIPSSSPYTVPKRLAIPSNISHARPSVLTTLHSFPTLEPLAFLSYPSVHLHLPLRRDLLHRAVVYEGDKTRQGTASTKWRDEIRGSGRKIRPQKGSGRARLGDKKSPMLRGGGVAFGPKPRDFSTDLPKKMYDIAWRTALSYRYRKGELVVVNHTNLESLKSWEGRGDNEWKERLPYYVKHLFERLGWGHANRRSLVVTKEKNAELEHALEIRGEQGRTRTVEDVDVKNLLEMGRVVIEKAALDTLLLRHQRDLTKKGVARVGSLTAAASKAEMAVLDEGVGAEQLEALLEEGEDVADEDLEGVSLEELEAQLRAEEGQEKRD